ncbi:MAG: adenosylmethionine--8-amino-7-oxononanoate transaminase [Chthoniobacterales bacterium]
MLFSQYDHSHDDLVRMDKKHVWHPFTQMQAWCDADHEPLVLVDGEGAMLMDSRGRHYLDGNSSIWTNIHGHKHPKITTAIKDQVDRVSHVSFLGSTNAPAIVLAERLSKCFPQDALPHVFFSDNGSTAIEVALKMAVQYHQMTGSPNRHRFVAFENAYHGDTAGAASVGGISTFHGRFSQMHFPVERIRSGEDLACLSDPEQIAAVVIEPLIQGAAGMRLWPRGLLRNLRAWCDSHGVFLILDEVMTGFGRTGSLFACEREQVVPDFIALAKGLTGGYLPLAATLTTARVYDAFLGSIESQRTLYYGHSYAGNAVACAAAIASLEIFDEEKTLTVLQPKIAVLQNLLSGLHEHPHVRDVRQCGLIAGIEIGRRDGTAYPWQELRGARACMHARAHGLLTRPVLDTITLMPPLCTTNEQLELAVNAIRMGIDQVCVE